MLKFLLVFFVLLVALWRWRQGRAEAQRPPAPLRKRPSPALPESIVSCRHCGLQLPQSESVRGHLGPYCSLAHRQLAEGRRGTAPDHEPH